MSHQTESQAFVASVQGAQEQLNSWMDRHALTPRAHGSQLIDDKVRTIVKATQVQLSDLSDFHLELIEANPYVAPSAARFSSIVGTGDRFGSDGIPASFGTGDVVAINTPYFNNEEVRSAVNNLAREYSGLATYFSLAQATWKGAEVPALHLQKGRRAKPAILLIGCIHGDEWGSCEILLHLASDLLRAETTDQPLIYGNVKYSADDIHCLLDQRSIFIVPVANPDGRALSQTSIGSIDHRRNRRDRAFPNDPDSEGVDLNRNFDFLFSTSAFHSATNIKRCEDPTTGNYQGPHPLSEPETQNIVALLDDHPEIGWLVDLHAPGRKIGHPWSVDQPQGSEPDQNFRNPQYQGQRGLAFDQYGEFLASSDQTHMMNLADRFVKEATAVALTPYTAGSDYGGNPKSGTCIDFTYARHLVDCKKPKILPFLLEWGYDVTKPSWPAMEKIVKEVSAGLIGLALQSIQNVDKKGVSA